MKKLNKKRRGRPRNALAVREPNGRISRSARQSKASAQAYREAIYARIRLFGLSEKDASDAKAGSVVGRLCLLGLISEDQYQAAQKYVEVRHAYLRAIGAKTDFREPRPDTESDGDYEGFCRRARSIWSAMQDALAELCIELRSPAPAAALDVIVNRDTEMRELTGDLRSALNCLDRHFFREKRRAA